MEALPLSMFTSLCLTQPKRTPTFSMRTWILLLWDVALIGMVFILVPSFKYTGFWYLMTAPDKRLPSAHLAEPDDDMWSVLWVEVERDTIQIENYRLTLTSLPDALRDSRQWSVQGTAYRFGYPRDAVLLVADRDTPMGDILPVIEAARRAGYEEIRFMTVRR